MPEKQRAGRASKAKGRGKAATTQAGAFVEEEMRPLRGRQRRGADAKQAIAIGLSRARRAGVKVPPPPPGRASEQTRRRAERDLKAGQRATARRSTRGKTTRAGQARTGTGRSSRSRQRP